MRNRIKEVFKIGPEVGACSLVGLEKPGYVLEKINRRGTKVTITFVKDPTYTKKERSSK